MTWRALLSTIPLLLALACTVGGEEDGGFTFGGTLGTSTTTLGTSETGDPGTTSAGGDCGDGYVDLGEQCDMGEGNGPGAKCTPDCQIAACGDGYVYEGFEDCDDGNTDNSDDCLLNCEPASCGDGYVHVGVEECDDGNDDDADGCTSECTPGACGDGILQAGEQCDDGDMDTSDECPACQLAFCGDGYIQAGVEQCDDGNMSDDDTCISVTCTNAFCGDGHVQAGVEECDDANMSDDDACPQCQVAFCGDGFTYEDVEDCDDANLVDDDGCSNTCESMCGGGFTQSWCLQVGTMEQYTRCESVEDGGATCINPEIRYGDVEGGIPRSHGGNQFVTWCQQLGFSGYAGQVQYGNRACNAPQGGLFGCTAYDEVTWHWCDWQDGNWYNQQLDWHSCTGSEITSITCTP